MCVSMAKCVPLLIVKGTTPEVVMSTLPGVNVFSNVTASQP